MEQIIEFKPMIHALSFDLLPESKNWKVGKSYRVKLVLRQVSVSESGADFEIVDATSLEPEDKGRRKFTSDSGTYVG